MPHFAHELLRRVAIDVLKAAGASQHEADVVGNHLVDANLVGHDSHGVIRIPQYLNDMEKGIIRSNTEYRLVHDVAGATILDASGTFAHVVCRDAIHMAMERARQQTIAVVSIRGANHTGRLGAYGSMCAAENMIGIVMVNGGGSGQWVAPFGGKLRRLGTNPLVIAAPSGKPFPLLVDMSTCTAPEGKIRHYYQSGKQVPDGWLIDGEGRPTNDPAALYAEIPGALMPLGAKDAHKGYGLSMMVDILAGALSGAGCCRSNVPQEQPNTHGVLMLAIDIGRFAPIEQFQQWVAESVDYMKSCPPAPGFDEVLVPGEYEYIMRQIRTRDGIEVPEATWNNIVQAANKVGLELTNGE